MDYQKKEKYIKRCLIFTSLVVLFFISSSVQAAGASFSFSSQGNAYNVGDTFSLGVYIQSPSQAINAFSGSIYFPSDKLSVISISKNNTIANLWVQEPTYSNDSGSISFQGVILSPGFIGSNGQIITINFQAKASGIAIVSFTSGSILANDGQGTNILDVNGLPSVQYAINVPSTIISDSSLSVPINTNGPLAPNIFSPTNPDPTKWYSSNDVKLEWQIPSGVDAVRLLYNKYPYSVPTILYKPPISEKEITGLTDGIYYFHAQFHDDTGWGAISNFKFQIDTTPPNPFDIIFASSSDPTNPSPAVYFNATDSLSGISYYQIKIDDQEAFNVSASQYKNGPYILPAQKFGAHIITVSAFDMAGNYRSATANFNIQPINSPTINNYDVAGNILVVKGTTYPNSTVTVWLQKENQISTSFTGTSNSNGEFTVIGVNLGAGNYKLYATVTDNRGAQSLPTNKYDISVSASILGMNFIEIAEFITFIIILVSMFLFNKHRDKRNKENIKKIKQVAEHDWRNYKKNIEQSVKSKIDILEEAGKMRTLTVEEKTILELLKKDLTACQEESIKKDLDKLK